MVGVAACCFDALVGFWFRLQGLSSDGGDVAEGTPVLLKSRLNWCYLIDRQYLSLQLCVYLLIYLLSL